MIKIGIDPDLDKSGFALTYQQTAEVTTYTISELFGRIVQLMEQFPNIPLQVYIEFGELNNLISISEEYRRGFAISKPIAHK